ncbi:MAG: hypothetical protein ACRDPE_20510, partial [Solirubrobacterales bacterium]
MPTPEERNKATVRRFQESFEGGATALTERTIDEVVAPEVLIRTPLPLDSTGPAALKEIVGRLRQAFSPATGGGSRRPVASSTSPRRCASSGSSDRPLPPGP